ncbi:hypothetical protein MRX96_012506 [Rhipicephalus microplus]
MRERKRGRVKTELPVFSGRSPTRERARGRNALFGSGIPAFSPIPGLANGTREPVAETGRAWLWRRPRHNRHPQHRLCRAALSTSAAENAAGDDFDAACRRSHAEQHVARDRRNARCTLCAVASEKK